MDDLVQFLHARLDERVACAQRAIDGPRNQFVSADEDIEPLLFDDDGVFVLPARVLAEVEAKRRILDDVLPTMQADELRIAGEWGVGSEPVREASDDLLSLLALPYAGHPDYREEWRP